jgi:hypothetical protein
MGGQVVNNRGEVPFRIQQAERIAQMKSEQENDPESGAEKKISFFEAQKQAVRSLRKAFQMDKEEGGSGTAVKSWFARNWMNVIIWLVALGIVWSMLSPKKQSGRSHHGINARGEAY